jgi:predicted DCC family thiol-disulfide oxidoreductase YuxK
LNTNSIILFDGVCKLCGGWVRFVIRRDPEARFRFAALQSPAGRRLLTEHGLGSEGIESVVLIQDGCAFTKSEATLRIVGALSGGWRLLGVFRLVPRAWRDWIYGFIARNRYRWFGQRESCLVPSEEIRRRFID